MKNKKLAGIMPAFLTAFNDDGIDTEAVRRLAWKLADCGVHGLYVGGSTGEFVLMSKDERKILLENVVDEIGDRISVIAHVGSMSTSDALELARHAEKTGADAVSSVTPLYYKYSFREVKYYYERLAAETSLPVIIYNIPAITGMTLNAEQLSEILSIENVGGMKFTSSDFFQLERLRSAFPDKVFYNGSDEMLCSGLAAGADGGIGSTYNFMPKTILKIYDSFCEGDAKKALEYQAAANEKIALILKYGVIPCCKELVTLGGISYGRCREPFMPLSKEAAEVLQELEVE